MSTDEIITQLEIEMELQRKAKLAQLAAKDRIKVLKIKLKYAETKKPKKKEKLTEKERFIREFQPDPDVIEFLEKRERTTDEVAKYLELPNRDEVSRRLRKGIYLPGPSNSTGKCWIDTLSVAKHLYAATSQE